MKMAKFTSWAAVPFLITLDQITKTMVVDEFRLGESTEVLGSFFRLTRVHNPGAAFGIFQNFPEAFTFLTAAAIIFVAIHKFLTSETGILYHSALGLILSGAGGNMIDRIRYNHVVDFLDFGIGSSRWPAFNVADACITTGVALLLISSFLYDPPEEDETETPSAATSSET